MQKVALVNSTTDG